MTTLQVASSTQGEKAGVSVQGEKAGGSVQGEKGGGSVQGEKGGGSAQGEKGGGSLQGEKGGGSAQAGGSVQGEEDGDASVDLSLLGATEDCVWLPKQKKFVQDKQQVCMCVCVRACVRCVCHEYSILRGLTGERDKVQLAVVRETSKTPVDLVPHTNLISCILLHPTSPLNSLYMCT